MAVGKWNASRMHVMVLLLCFTASSGIINSDLANVAGFK